jgi:3-methylfumaryl-CoA hydratase
MATLLLNLATVETGTPPGRFTYRGLAPAICGETLMVCAGTEDDAGSFWVEGPDGEVRMEAQASNS